MVTAENGVYQRFVDDARSLIRAAGSMTQTEGTTMNTETRTSPNLDQIRDQQRATWDKFSAGWKKMG